MDESMPDSQKQIRLCDCNRSFTLDAEQLAAAGATVACHHALCAGELPLIGDDLAAGREVFVSCTQETALFAELADATGTPAGGRPAAERIHFFNLRENAGWSADAASATASAPTGVTPKLAALIAAATTLPEPDPVPAVQMKAGRSLLIIGEAGVALGWA
ncbi:hypothetical protein RZS08_09595, partial [Arthrospira platensis SPKY1]|nr:hypothetical protein [Arthrospira platensis SPKY1]